MDYARVDAAEELLSGFDALLDWRFRLSFRDVAVHLCGIEHGISASEQQTRPGQGRLVAVVSLGRIVSKLPEHYRGSLLALADLRPAFLPLLIRCPFSAFIAFRLR